MPARPLAVVPAWRWWAGFGVFVGIAGALSLIAYADGLPDILGQYQIDKGMHFMLAGLLVFFLDGAVARRALFAVRGFAVPLSAVLVLTPVGLEEYLQRYALLRTSSVWDFAADVLGVAVFVVLSRRAAK